jgi:hypothetical protein
MNVHNVSDVRQIEVHKTEPLVPGRSRLQVEIAVAKYYILASCVNIDNKTQDHLQ